MKIKIPLKDFLELGGKLETITEAVNDYNNKKADFVEFSHTNPASYGSPKGVQMYKIGGTTVAIDWIKVYVEVVLDPKHLG